MFGFLRRYSRAAAYAATAVGLAAIESLSTGTAVDVATPPSQG